MFSDYEIKAVSLVEAAGAVEPSVATRDAVAMAQVYATLAIAEAIALRNSEYTGN